MVIKKNKKGAKSASAPKVRKSKYAKVSKAQVFGHVNYIRPGAYIAVINSIEEGENHQDKAYVQVNLRVLASDPAGPTGYDYESTKNGEPRELDRHKVGDEIVDKMMSDNIAFGQNMKSLAMVAGELTEDDFEQEDYPGQVIEEMVGEDQPLAGRVIQIKASQVVKKAARGKDEEDLTNSDVYTRVDYLALLDGEEILEEVDAEVIEKFDIQVDGDETEETTEDDGDE